MLLPDLQLTLLMLDGGLLAALCVAFFMSAALFAAGRLRAPESDASSLLRIVANTGTVVNNNAIAAADDLSITTFTDLILQAGTGITAGGNAALTSLGGSIIAQAEVAERSITRQGTKYQMRGTQKHHPYQQRDQRGHHEPERSQRRDL